MIERGAQCGGGTLRREQGVEPAEYSGTLHVHGIPYFIRAAVECDIEGKFFALRIYNARRAETGQVIR